jgi:pyruvate/2-oxoglutarate dehydrogenase complex dihydrolipoamide acyltransferase (E2) component
MATKNIDMEDILSKSWPSQSAAQAWLRRHYNTNMTKLSLTIGMAPESGVCFQPFEAAEGEAEKPAKAKPAKVAKAKPAKPAKAEKPAKAKPAKATNPEKDERLNVLARAFRAAKRESGVTRVELRKMRLEAGVGTIAWADRLERMAEANGQKFKVKKEGRHPSYFVL